MFRRIRWKLLATYIVVLLPAVIFLGVHLTRQFERLYADQLKRDLLDLARLMAVNAADSLVTGDAAAIQAHLNPPHHDRHAPIIVVTDRAGIVVAAGGEPAPRPGQPADDPSVAEALQGREVVSLGTGRGSGDAVSATIPVSAQGRIVGTVRVGRPLTALHGQIRHVRWVVAWAAVVALLLAGSLGLLLARSIAGPVQEMQRAASGLAAGKLQERVPIRTQDELGDLARSLNYMASELERIDSLRRAFVADASHELRTPVANLAVAIEALKAVVRTNPDEAARVAADLEREVGRLRRLAEELLDLSQVESDHVRLNLAPVSPVRLIELAAEGFAPRAAQAGVAVRREIPGRVSRVTADAERTVQVLTNLLDNALKHTSGGGEIVLSAAERRGHVVIGVADTGPGIPEAELPHIFDRFYKVDKARSGRRGGAGLGLAIAKRLVEAQGGIIMVESKEGQGARFLVALPKEASRTRLLSP